MDKLIEKHDNERCDFCGIGNVTAIDHANITKEVACGFKGWCDEYLDADLSGVSWHELLDRSVKSDEELFGLYIKSL